MKISVFYDHILQAKEQSGKSMSSLLQMVYDEGIRGIEIRLSDLLQDETIPSRLQKAGLQISCVFDFYEMGLKNERSRGIQHIDMAEKLGANRILVVPGFLEEEEAETFHLVADSDKIAVFMEQNKSIMKMKENLLELVAYAKKSNVLVTVEDFDDRKSPLSRMYAIKWFLEQVPGLAYTLDMGNFIYSNEDVLQAWELLQDYIVHVHCKNRGEDMTVSGGINPGLLPISTGEGYLPVGKLVENLQEIGYEGYLAIEHFDAPDQEDCIKRSAKYLRDITLLY